MSPGLFSRLAIVSAVAAVAAGSASLADGASIDDGDVPVRGVVKAIDQAAISTDVVAPVSKIGFRTGEAFKAGELLVAFDCERYRAEAQAAEAVWTEMQLTVESNAQLEKFRAVGKHDVDISKARVAKAEAEARSLKTRVSHCEIFAPFDGRVADLAINVFEQPQQGKPFLTIVGHGRLEIELIVPSNWLGWIKPHARFAFTADETGRDYAANVVRIGAAVDAVSQMVKIIAAFETPPADILPGMSGVAHFDKPNG
ncbi:MAG: efflux RND transporter periplasmic adaptor subunit [Hyphomicrobium sp.]